MADISRDSFVPSKNYKKVIYQQLRPVLDAELNETQDIITSDVRNMMRAVVGNKPVGEGFSVVATGVANQVRVTAGNYIADGVLVTLLADELVTLAAPPMFGSRVDMVIARVNNVEINSIADPDLIDPIINAETAIRLQQQITLQVVTGSTTLPTPASGELIFEVARITRNAGASIVTTPEIEDVRDLSNRSYVVSGLEVSCTTLLNYAWTSGEAVVRGVSYVIPAGTGTLSPNSINYVYVNDSGNVVDGLSNPPSTFCLLSTIETDATNCTGMFDNRNWGGAVTGTLEILDEGISIGNVEKINFIGTGVTAALNGLQADVTITGGGGGGGSALDCVTYTTGTAQGTYGGSTTVFDLPFNVAAAGCRLMVFTSNIIATESVDYTITGTAQVTFSSARIAGELIKFYLFTIGSGGGGALTCEEYTTGTPASNYTGSTTVFDVVADLTGASCNLLVFSSAVKMRQGDDYSVTGASQITFVNPRTAGEPVELYIFNSGTSTPGTVDCQIYVSGTPAAPYTGSTTVFDLPFDIQPNDCGLLVFGSGIKLVEGDDYTVTGLSQVTFGTSRPVGYKVEFYKTTLVGLVAPGPHASTHQNGGSDEISVAGLSGQLADAQKVHVKDEGVLQGTVDTLSFVGAGVTATVSLGVATVTIPGGSGQLIIVEEQQPSGTDGAAFASFAWSTRVLNTLSLNEVGGTVTLSANQLTLPAGTYEITAHSTLVNSSGVASRARFRATDASVNILGQTGGHVTSGASGQAAYIFGKFTIATSKTFELQHYAQYGVSVSGGLAMNIGDAETYSQVVLRKVA